MPDALDEERRAAEEDICPRCGDTFTGSHACADRAPRIAPHPREAWCPCLPYMRNQWQPSKCDVCGRVHA